LARSVPPLARVLSLALLLLPLRIPRTAPLLMAPAVVTHHPSSMMLRIRRSRSSK
jgi:hypothetical protein